MTERGVREQELGCKREHDVLQLSSQRAHAKVQQVGTEAAATAAVDLVVAIEGW